VTNDFVVTDYLSLELSGGYPILKIDHGSGVKILTLTAQNGSAKIIYIFLCAKLIYIGIKIYLKVLLYSLI
jgi:hypothetical protein